MAVAFNPNVVEVNMIHSWAGQNVENVLYFFGTTEPGSDDIQELVDALRTYWQTNMLPLMSEKIAFLIAEGIKMEPTPAETATAAATIPNLGGQASPALPNSNSITIAFKTGLSGRSYRGRNFWLGLTEVDVVDNVVDSDLIANIVTAYGGMMGAGAVLSGWTWGVYSQIHDNAPRESGLFTSITSVTITDYTIDSQRRRLPGRGR